MYNCTITNVSNMVQWKHDINQGQGRFHIPTSCQCQTYLLNNMMVQNIFDIKKTQLTMRKSLNVGR